MTEIDDDQQSYIIFAQINVNKSPMACNELGMYLDKLMKSYRYDNSDSAGIVINRRPEMDDNYARRLKNLGIVPVTLKTFHRA